MIGSRTVWNEVELTLLITDVFKSLGLSDYVIKINHREILFQLAAYVGLKGKEIGFCAEIDKLDKIGAEKVVENVSTMGAEKDKVDKLMELFNVEDHTQRIEKVIDLIQGGKGIEDINEFFGLIASFKERNLKVELDLSLARGLSYYTGIIFEVKPTSVEMGSICGGGRYDDLTGIFGLNDISGVGISFGLDRIYDVMTELDLFPEKIAQRIDVLILHFDQQTQQHGQHVVMKLRDQGIKAELYPEVVKIQKQFNYADKVGAPYTLIIGDEEMKSGNYSLKNMANGDQQKGSLQELIEVLRG